MESSKTALNQCKTGYIQSITPLRQGMKWPYFEGILQERHKTSKLMVFKSDLHNHFQTVEKDG